MRTNSGRKQAGGDITMLQQQQRTWARRTAELEHELTTLRDKHDLHRRFPEPEARQPTPATPTEPTGKRQPDQPPSERATRPAPATPTEPTGEREPDQPPSTRATRPATPARSTDISDRQLTAALGPVPDDDWQRRLWHGLADEIRTYRPRWKITDPRTLLGADTADPNQERERQELAELLRASARELSSEPRRSHDHPSDADIARSAARQYRRSVVTER